MATKYCGFYANRTDVDYCWIFSRACAQGQLQIAKDVATQILFSRKFVQRVLTRTVWNQHNDVADWIEANFDLLTNQNERVRAWDASEENEIKVRELDKVDAVDTIVARDAIALA